MTTLLTRKIPVSIITGFLGAGKTTLVRHLLENTGDRRLAVIVNEFGETGVDGEVLRSCGLPECEQVEIVELANGCICCTVADDFIPTLEALLALEKPPEHILIETSGLALPKPLLKAFDWPAVRTRLTVDGVITVVDAPAFAEGRFADDPDAVARQRALDPSVDHDNPLSEVFEDQLSAADIVILNKTDLIAEADIAALIERLRETLPRAVKIVPVREGRGDLATLLDLRAAAEDDLASRPSHHDGADGHEHDDFESFTAPMAEATDPDSLVERLKSVVEAHDILRMKGFFAVAGKARRLQVQGVGSRFRWTYDAPLAADAPRAGHVVVIGQKGLDQPAILSALRD